LSLLGGKYGTGGEGRSPSNMIIVYCDRCKNRIEGLWNVRIISNKWSDNSGRQLAEICDKCEHELEAWLGKPRKKWETGYKPEEELNKDLKPC
jgi:hypothetical protein